MVTHGQTAKLRCNIDALANFTWVRNGTVLTNQRKTLQTTTGVLLVSNVSSVDAGEYICLAQTRSKNILAASATLKIGGVEFIIRFFNL